MTIIKELCGVREGDRRCGKRGKESRERRLGKPEGRTGYGFRNESSRGSSSDNTGEVLCADVWGNRSMDAKSARGVSGLSLAGDKLPAPGGLLGT